MKMNLRSTTFSAVLLGLMTIAASAQEAAAAGVHKKTLMDLFHEGGWVMYPITLCSVAMIWFIVDGYIRTSTGKLYPLEHVTQLRELFKKGDYVGAYAFAKSAGSPVADVVRAAHGKDRDARTLRSVALVMPTPVADALTFDAVWSAIYCEPLAPVKEEPPTLYAECVAQQVGSLGPLLCLADGTPAGHVTRIQATPALAERARSMAGEVPVEWVACPDPVTP